MEYVIIGNGPAAVSTVEAIRRCDAEGSITLFSKENEFTYSRPLISYLLLGETDERLMRYKPDDFYQEHRVDVRLGVEVTAIDKEAHTVAASDGSVTPYDRLLLATGAVPFVPPMALRISVPIMPPPIPPAISAAPFVHSAGFTGVSALPSSFIVVSRPARL